jgi:hypothetical protein
MAQQRHGKESHKPLSAMGAAFVIRRHADNAFPPAITQLADESADESADDRQYPVNKDFHLTLAIIFTRSARYRISLELRFTLAR